MAATSIFRCLYSFTGGPPHPHRSAHHRHHPLISHCPHQLPVLRLRPTTQFSRRPSNSPQESDGVFNEGLKWNGIDFMGNGGERDYEDDEEEEEEDDRSLELLVQFVENIFKKVSRRARKAARSVLPPAISTKLVGFAVNGAMILAFLWILKAFLEVVCAMGSVVFVSILLVRGVWSGVTFFQENQNRQLNDIEDDPRTWSGTQPVA